MENRNIVEDLMRPEAYPWHPESVELIETHISWVFLAGDRVVKLKRPVAFPFVDHTSLTSRHQSCRDEVRLNRRLTDGVYLDVVPIVQTPGGCRVGEEGTPVEWATLMRRLPASRMLDTLLASGAVPGDLVDRLAARLIPFHRDIAAECGSTREAATTATEIVTDNLDELAPFAGAPIGPIQFGLVTTAMRRFVSEQDDLLQERALAGWIREGHGDLRAEHVCLEEDGTVQVFDTSACVVSSVPRLATNLTLLHALKDRGYTGVIALTAHHRSDAMTLEQAGASVVLRPFFDAAEQAAQNLAEIVLVDRPGAESPFYDAKRPVESAITNPS